MQISIPDMLQKIGILSVENDALRRENDMLKQALADVQADGKDVEPEESPKEEVSG